MLPTACSTIRLYVLYSLTTSGCSQYPELHTAFIQILHNPRKYQVKDREGVTASVGAGCMCSSQRGGTVAWDERAGAGLRLRLRLRPPRARGPARAGAGVSRYVSRRVWAARPVPLWPSRHVRRRPVAGALTPPSQAKPGTRVATRGPLERRCALRRVGDDRSRHAHAPPAPPCPADPCRALPANTDPPLYDIAITLTYRFPISSNEYIRNIW